ncbi:MAG: DUF1028 domain-containing protein [Armatimonadota bacterium]|nr:DUF1028 domain-containing protein [Armatimonadota bacterium]
MRPSTFSIVARDPATGEVGVAVASKFLAVGAVVPWARAGVGAIATQAWANLSFGPDGLALLGQGLPAPEVLRRLTEGDEGRDHRQVGVVDAAGRAAAWTGRECMPWAGHNSGDGYTCQGNILVGEAVIRTMAEAFEDTAGPLPERLVAALAAGQAAGGDSRGQQSAALYVAREKGSYGGTLDRYIDLRVDDHPTPVDELRRLLDLHRLYFGPTNAANLTRLAGNVARMVQQMLAKAGFYQGPIDGVYGPQTRDAFRRWCGVENFEERWREDDLVDREVLAYMRRRYGS